MTKIWACAAVLISTLFFQGCAALPEGAVKPGLTLESAAIADDEGKAAFEVEISLSHDSLTPLPLKGIEVTVFVNGAPAASYQEKIENVSLNPREKYTYRLKVKANLLPELSSRSLAYNRMVKADASIMVRAVFDQSEDNLSFNPTATFEGIIGHVQ